MCQKPQAAN